MNLSEIVMAAKLAAKMTGGSGSGSSGASAYTLINGVKNSIEGGVPCTIYPVDTLPENPEPYVNTDLTKQALYLRTSDSTLHTYIDEFSSQGTNMPVGWINVNDIGLSWTLVTSPDEATEADTLYVVYNAGSSSSGGSTTAIIDVDTLPAENINGNAFYRVSEDAYTLINGQKNLAPASGNMVPVIIHIVDELPSEGDIFVDYPATRLVGYFNRKNLTTWVYFPDTDIGNTLANEFGASVGWNTSASISFDFVIVNSPDEAIDNKTLYLVYTAGGLFAYNGTEWVEYVTKAQLDEVVANAGGGKLYRHSIVVGLSQDNEGNTANLGIHTTIFSNSSTQIDPTDLSNITKIFTQVSDDLYMLFNFNASFTYKENRYPVSSVLLQLSNGAIVAEYFSDVDGQAEWMFNLTQVTSFVDIVSEV